MAPLTSAVPESTAPPQPPRRALIWTHLVLGATAERPRRRPGYASFHVQIEVEVEAGAFLGGRPLSVIATTGLRVVPLAVSTSRREHFWGDRASLRGRGYASFHWHVSEPARTAPPVATTAPPVATTAPPVATTAPPVAQARPSRQRRRPSRQRRWPSRQRRRPSRQRRRPSRQRRWPSSMSSSSRGTARTPSVASKPTLFRFVRDPSFHASLLRREFARSRPCSELDASVTRAMFSAQSSGVRMRSQGSSGVGEVAKGIHRASQFKKRTRGEWKQQSIAFPNTWGGKRKGAGRKRLAARPNVPHRARPAHGAGHPVLATLRARFRPLRSQYVFPLPGIVHFSVQWDHLHLMVEASDERALSRGMQGVAIRIARSVNGLVMRRGRFWADRWHGRALTSPRQVRSALVYVLANFQKARGDATASWYRCIFVGRSFRWMARFRCGPGASARGAADSWGDGRLGRGLGVEDMARTRGVEAIGTHPCGGSAKEPDAPRTGRVPHRDQRKGMGVCRQRGPGRVRFTRARGRC